MKPEQTIRNSGRLCSVYCPSCGKVTDKISFNLLREADSVSVVCPVCGEDTLLEYDGKRVTVTHPAAEEALRVLSLRNNFSPETKAPLTREEIMAQYKATEERIASLEDKARRRLAQSRLKKELGREPTEEEIAAEAEAIQGALR
ncbi:MAG: hypothetical protein LBR23_10030 [Spirochaetaceae bacterium]|jgi:uncharacterized Zn finger protein (UPF0148 family)|nr:hypothetical protein [Spirochaetaceae bacterium]